MVDDLEGLTLPPGRAESFGVRAPFCGVAVRNLAEVQVGEVVILGAPFDWGASHRPGARFGPRAIREADYLSPDGSRPHLTAGVDPLRDLPVVDAGDVAIVGGNVKKSLQRIEEAVHTVMVAGGIPLVLGGDHTVTLPNATGVARHLGFGEVALVHFDAHADTPTSSGVSGTPTARRCGG